MAQDQFVDEAAGVATTARELADRAAELAARATEMSTAAPAPADPAMPYLVIGLTVFVLAVFVGYYVVWRVTPALHSPLLSVTNAVSSVIVVGALIAAGPADWGLSKVLGFVAVLIASVNIFGGFIVTQRMLHMYKKKQ